jgi:hypothetical protein
LTTAVEVAKFVIMITDERRAEKGGK